MPVSNCVCYLCQVLSSDQVLDCDESVVFDAASRWLQADSPSRRKHAPEVILLLYVVILLLLLL